MTMQEPCPARLAVRGVVYLCESSGDHDTHRSEAAGAIWQAPSSDVTSPVSANRAMTSTAPEREQ